MDKTKEKQAEVTDKIGICFSGGGFRASTFHLGALSYLDHTGLIKKLSMISTVSGGSFTGAKYVLSLAEKAPFTEFFTEFYRFHREVKLVSETFAYLASNQSETASGRNTLITSIAHVYADSFLRTEQGEYAFLGDILDADIDMQEMILNTTEFRHGLDFRIQKSDNKRVKIGNNKINIPVESAKKIRLADAVAASSCFPGGFEPIVFPDDFVWKDKHVPEEVKEKFQKDGKPDPIALMDGGIYDNQGIESLMLADKRNLQELGMFIISDVFQIPDDNYPVEAKNPKGFLTLNMVNIISVAMLVICILAVIGIGWNLFNKFETTGLELFSDFFLNFFPILLAASTGISIIAIRGFIKNDLLDEIPQARGGSWDDFKKITIARALNLVAMRIRSMYTLTNSIFLTRIRSLCFGLIYNDKDFDGKRVSNLIYNLKKGAKFSSILEKNGIAPPSEIMTKVGDIGENIPRTFWFVSRDPWELPCLFASGQFTLCYNLMKLIARNCEQFSSKDEWPEDTLNLWNKLEDDWNNFREDPYHIVKDYLGDDDLVYPE